MTEPTTKRKRYVREVKASWWKKNGFYKLYIVREMTAIPTLWFSLVLLYGVICIAQAGIATGHTNNGFSFDVFMQAFGSFVTFLQNPIVVILNIITLGAAILNTFTYFNMTPKVMNIVVGDSKLNPMVITALLWVITIIVSIVALVLLYIV